MGRPLKIKMPEEMEQIWEDYKNDCDNQEVLIHDFSSKNSEFVSATLTCSITYTVKGFCMFVRIFRHAFYEHYSQKKRIESPESNEASAIPTAAADPNQTTGNRALLVITMVTGEGKEYEMTLELGV
ncbi:hypothetical protein [Lacrimispora brassicae]